MLGLDLIVDEIVKRALNAAIDTGWRSLSAHWHLGSQMPYVDRCWNKVREELRDCGLLYDGGYLDHTRLEIAWLPSLGEAGYVYEGLTWFAATVGYEEGVIYLPADLPRKAYVPGGTLTDIIRHEYAHAWHWLDPEYFNSGWFVRAFHGEYDSDDSTPAQLWQQRLGNSPEFVSANDRCRNERERESLLSTKFRDEFVSGYAATLICEDFAETFMYFLRYRRCLDKFSSRQGLYMKLKAIEHAVQDASRSRVARVIFCPVSGDRLELPSLEKRRSLKCDCCGSEILVEDGKPVHQPLEVECPVAKRFVTLEGAEAEDDFECPHCGASITVEDCKAAHATSLDVECPVTGNAVELHGVANGDVFVCPDCSDDITIKDGVVAHR